jgi:PAS domain S-box-containing protein
MSRKKRRRTKGDTAANAPPFTSCPGETNAIPPPSLLDALPCGVLVLDSGLRILQTNTAARNLLADMAGFDPAAQNVETDFTGQALDATPLAPLNSYCTAALTRQPSAPFSKATAITPNQGRLFISGCATRFMHDDKTPGVLLAACDVTTGVLVQEQGRVLSRFTEEIPQAIVIVSADGCVVYANKASTAFLQGVGSHVGGFLPESFREWVAGSFATGQSCKMEFTEKDSAYSVTLVPLPDCGYAILYGLDVSWCTHNADLLRIKNRILNISQNAIAMADNSGNITYVNPAFPRMWGFETQEEILGRQVPQFWQSPETIRGVIQVLRDTNEWSGELAARRKDGTTFRAQVLASMMQDPRTGATAMVASFVDITEQEAALEALRGSEYRYQNLMEVTSDWIWEINARGIYTYVNPQVKNVLGFEPEEVLERTPWDIVPHDDAEAVTELFKHHLDFRIPFRLREFVFQHKQGHHVIVESSAIPIMNSRGQYCGMMGIDRDITRRKLAQDALKREHSLLENKVAQRTRELFMAYELLEKSEAYHRAVLEEQTELICRFRPDGTLTYVNESYCRYFARTREELVGSYFKPNIPEEDRMDCEMHFYSLTPQNPVGTLEHRVSLPDGKIRWQQWVNRAIFDENQELCEFQSVGRDITDRILAEQAFRQASEERETLRRDLEAVFQSISDAIITVDRDMRLLRCNSALFSLCARAKDMCQGERLNSLFSEEANPPCIQSLRQVLESGEPVRGLVAECTCGVKERQVTTLNATPLFDQEGDFSGAVLVIRDVTRLDQLERCFEGRSKYRNMVGKSRKMREIYSILEQLSDLKTTVLVTGESGTGKELIVEALHYSSSSITGPLVKVNCSALAENLLESELFGHVKGAFTGAIQDKIGRFAAAEGGTVFLDEIGDLSPSIQLKLLRFLESKEFERVGESVTHKADVRVVAATNVDLTEKMRQGLFREDLYYRLRVMVVHAPPLRERTEDIPLLASHFVGHFAEIFGKTLHTLTGEVLEVFLRYPWPGNVRELKHALEHASILCPGGHIALQHLPLELQEFVPSLPVSNPAPQPDDASERKLLLHILEKARWNKTSAAKLLGVSRTTLYRKLQEQGITL